MRGTTRSSFISFMIDGWMTNPMMILVVRFSISSSFDLSCMLLQYRNIGKFITLYMVAAVVGLRFIRTLQAASFLKKLFCTF